MTHQSHIKKEKFRQWVKAGLGLGYLKEGLAPFCNDIAKQQQTDILDNIKRKYNVPSVICGTCNIKTLQPDHVKIGNKQCPYGHVNCNCCYSSGKTPCPNKTCGAIYDSIITKHASTPPAPFWKNTQTQQWTTDPWSVAKCFINAPGYEQKASAADTDCTGLLHVIINNKYFHNHVNIAGSNIFSKVRQYRNEIFHSSTMELDSLETNSYIDDMIAVLQDGKELIHRQDAQETVKKLQDLKREDFVITTENVEKVLGEIRVDLGLIKETTKGLSEDNDDLKMKVASHESKISELIEVIQNLKEDYSKKEKDFDTLKADLQEKLIEVYRKTILRMPAMPCQPEHLCELKDVYVTPRITLKSKDENIKEKIETEVKTLSDILIKDGQPLKSIYILGEAGSGKSSFCKSLVHSWCMAHSKTPDYEGQKAKRQKGKGLNTEDFVIEMNEMKNFRFLFFISLRHCTDVLSIKGMLEEEYQHPVLKDLLERESETCLIVLDGLDEWTNRTTLPPKPSKFSNYTVITTSRPWKIGALGIDENEIQQTIHIDGFDDTSRMNMIKNTVEILHTKFPDNEKGKDKDGPWQCEKELTNKSFDSLTHTAMLLQQLICLWFDDRLQETSKCNLYTCMLDLFFVWYKQKVPHSALFNDMPNKSHDIKLPKSLNKTDECKSQSYFIQCVSRLAYEALIKNEKEASLSFDSSMFEQLGISNDVKDYCLNLGILSEEKCPSLSASRSQKSHLSFIHKSVQEYLAAVYIVLNIKTEHESSNDTEGADFSVYMSEMLNFKSLDEFLEQENVLIMLCSLEPRLAKSISQIVKDIVGRDKRVLKYRTTIDDRSKQCFLMKSIQTMILNCIEETKASNENYQFNIYLNDILFDTNFWIYWFNDTDRLLTCIDEQNIIFDSVISFSIDLRFDKEGKNTRKMFDFMTKCKNIGTIIIHCNVDKDLCGHICDRIETYASTLKRLSLDLMSSSVRALCIDNMTHLVALKLKGFSLSHQGFTSLCTFLSGTGNLQQISIDIKCECEEQHGVDLSQHKQLQYLKYNKPVVVTNAELTNLEIFSSPKLNRINYIKVFDIINHCKKLKKIVLSYDVSRRNDRSNVHAAVTSKLIHLLRSLKQLRVLQLDGFTFTDSIISCPSEMKSLESIDIISGRMSLATWRKFVDSFTELPQRVARDGEECNSDKEWWRGEEGGGGGEKTAAFQYGRERAFLFDMLWTPDICFKYFHGHPYPKNKPVKRH